MPAGTAQARLIRLNLASSKFQDQDLLRRRKITPWLPSASSSIRAGSDTAVEESEKLSIFAPSKR
jgi:hypothetical protein